ncbi:MAG: sodium:proton antiporter [Candidatus Omnitrophica bacterium]|nr:sodium:proton antiporter [Candidatus Omnitrophota bacterium]
MFADLVWATPFAVLLGSIAVLPLTHKHFWEKNYHFIALGLAVIVALHYLLGLKNASPLLHTAHEYFSFIALIGSLYIVAGGIHINVKGEATPLVNCVFLLIGAVLANFLGTTGASMVLIRPWIRMNKYRLTAFHIVFFIFIVSNIGGGLTPIGDPPLFLGYLRGVPFFWVLEKVWMIWLLGLGLVLFIFYCLDIRNFKKAPAQIRQKETGGGEQWRFGGSHNVFFLLMILGSVFINNPPFLRELIMIAAAILSYKTTPRPVHEANDFSFAPIREVAILFAGIFVTMLPALEWLEHNAGAIGIQTPGQFYWGCGILSSVLDNAPTYLNFLSAALGLFGSGDGSHSVSALLANHPIYVRAISVAAVFFGAMTYIGNGPNFLVKSIADHSKVKTPSFFGYVLCYSLPVLLPVFTLIWFLFFRVPN